MLKIVFMGTPEFAVPALEAIHAEKKEFEITAVISQPDRKSGRGLKEKPTPVKAKALELGLPVYQPEKMSDAKAIDFLRAQKPDVAVVVAYGQILTTEVLKIPKHGCINIHSSLLPRWRGAAPIVRALLEGDTETGVTTMKIVEKLDAGPIYFQEKTSIAAEENAQELHDRLAVMGGALIVKTLRALAKNSLTNIIQDESLVTYAKKISKEMEWLDCSQSMNVVDRQVRALNPWPGTSIRLASGERLKILSARPLRGMRIDAGKLTLKNGMVLLGVKDGALELVRLQWEGRPAVDAAAFINGLKGKFPQGETEWQIVK